jgi:hypothetical protein
MGIFGNRERQRRSPVGGVFEQGKMQSKDGVGGCNQSISKYLEESEDVF